LIVPRDGLIFIEAVNLFANPNGWPIVEMQAPQNAPGPEIKGVLGRLHLTDGPPRRIGKEVDRLDEDEDLKLGDVDPAEYRPTANRLEWALRRLADEPASKIAPLIGMSEKRFRHIRRGLVKRTRSENREAIIRLALSRASQTPRNQ
jgi:hypothetical protein